MQGKKKCRYYRGYSYTTQPGTLINGERGHDYQIFDASGRLVGGGWSLGKRRDAEQDAEQSIRDRERRTALVSAGACS